jgi:hypothetical protein
MSDIPSLRADYDKKWEAYDKARQEALAKAEESVKHLRLESQKAYTVLATACRSKIC